MSETFPPPPSAFLLYNLPDNAVSWLAGKEKLVWCAECANNEKQGITENPVFVIALNCSLK